MSQASQVRTYDRATSVVFLKTNERFGGLSNMAPGFPLRVNGVRIRTSEALYQACRFPHLPDVQRKIIDEHSPMTAKMRSKPFRNDSRPDWDTVRVKIMKWCLRVKLAHHWSSFGKLLVDTGDRPIVEQSRKDDFWGAKVDDDGKLVGMNVLGRLLMELREEIKSGMRERSTIVLPLEISNFFLFGQLIEPVGFDLRSGVARSQHEERQSGFRETPAPVETAQRSFFQPVDNGMDAPALPNRIEMQSPPPAAHPQTINGLRPYPETKPSGLPWLGDVPTHWDVLRTKRLLAPTQLPVRPDDEIVTCFRDGQVTLRKNRRSSGFMIALLEQGYQGVRTGQLVVHSMDAFAGAIGVSDSDGKCTPEYIVCEPRADVVPGYYSWVLRLAARAGFILASCPAVRERAPRLRYPDLGELRLPVPPLDEQRLIVRFLDWHGAQTAKLIRAKKKIIALLNEQKQAIIHRAVTRGLDPNVRLKPSGIPWLGDVPERWEVKKLKFLARFNNGLAFKPSDWEGSGTPIIRIQNLNGSDAFNYTTKADLPADMLIANGDIVFSWSGNIGTSFGPFVWDREFSGYLNQHIFKLERITQHRKYFYYVLKAVTKHVEENAQGIIGLVHITKPELGSIAVPLAPPHEQIEIATWLDAQLIGLNNLIDRAQREIALIQEFRTRLIADVVTGKLDVRAIAASLPETSEAEPIDDLTEDDDLDEAVDDAENEEVAA